MLNAQSWSCFAHFFYFVNPFCLDGGPFEGGKRERQRGKVSTWSGSSTINRKQNRQWVGKWGQKLHEPMNRVSNCHWRWKEKHYRQRNVCYDTSGVCSHKVRLTDVIKPGICSVFILSFAGQLIWSLLMANFQYHGIGPIPLPAATSGTNWSHLFSGKHEQEAH